MIGLDLISACGSRSERGTNEEENGDKRGCIEEKRGITKKKHSWLSVSQLVHFVWGSCTVKIAPGEEERVALFLFGQIGHHQKGSGNRRDWIPILQGDGKKKRTTKGYASPRKGQVVLWEAKLGGGMAGLTERLESNDILFLFGWLRTSKKEMF